MIIRLDISPPLARLAGVDRFFAEGKNITRERDGIVHETRTVERYISHDRIELTEFVGGNVIDRFYVEVRMPGQNVSCTGVTENQTSGAVTFKFSSGNNTELENWEAAGAMADTVDADPTLAEKLLIAKAFRASPDGANKTTQVGASVSINCLADTPVVYTEPQ